MRIPRELKVMHLNNANAKKFLNWKPSLELEKGIEQEYLWLKKDPKRWITMSY
jgi:nucleoside-diphosphate-sugar epimerase